uniref:UV excision repair protein RAD23 n=1 Tax=Strombidinopsis acuminata TaxID=141414 RepID=A0A7S3U2X9_9SPIT
MPAALQELRNHPQFAQLAMMVAQNPQVLAQMLPALQQSNPELVQAIQENPQAFMQLLQEVAGGGGGPQDPVAAMMAAAGGGGGGGGAPGGPQPTVIRLSEDERAAVERLTALGFDRNMAVQAYLACDKNEELAANFLFDNGMDTSD